MKLMIIGILFGIGMTAQAATYEFTCTLEKYKSDGELLFQVNDPHGDASYEFAYTDYEGRDIPFSYSGEKIEWLWLHFWEADRPLTNSNGDLILEAYDEDCGTGKLHLYKNSGFNAGYMILGSCDPTLTNYSKVSCSSVKL
jgi:hypothetical protein